MEAFNAHGVAFARTLRPLCGNGRKKNLIGVLKMELKKVGKKYHLELDFDELDVIYHALGLYGDGLNNIMSMQWGMRLTGGEVAYWKKAGEIVKVMRTNESLLYHCLAFEGEGLPSAGEEE
ncbi:MAG: hypothetical protein J6C79_01430 [Clostridia bacterium]|nr:hypothetical protein [Clostridia bacterium]